MEENVIKDLQSFGLSHEAISGLINQCIALGKNIIVAVIIYLVGRFIIGKIKGIVRTIMNKRKVEPSLFSFVDSTINIVLNFVLFIAVISIIGIETSSFVALFASAGMAVGMALSGTLQNFAGGVMVLIFKPYKVGDTIEALGFTGTVKQIQIFNTILCTPDNQTIIIPNGSLSTGSMKNYSAADTRRVDINVEVAYGTKPEDVRNVLNKLIEADARIIKEGAQAPTIPMTSMSASSIVFQMRLWVKTADYWAVMGDTVEGAYTSLTAAGIEIPYQQVDVHMR